MAHSTQDVQLYPIILYNLHQGDDPFGSVVVFASGVDKAESVEDGLQNGLVFGEGIQVLEIVHQLGQNRNVGGDVTRLVQCWE